MAKNQKTKALSVPARSSNPGSVPSADTPPAHSPFPVVGIGASAGGLAAFEAFFQGMPESTDPGMAFALVQHLAPDHKSMLVELMRRYTRMPVFEVEDGMVVRINCVYIIPPNYDMAYSQGAFYLLEPLAPRGQRMAIDYFFQSLASDQNEFAVGIVLSGTGSDGTLGARAIKSAGGMVIAQDPATAEFPGMPHSVLATQEVELAIKKIFGMLRTHTRLQSAHEELESSNEELHSKGIDLSRANNDMNNLLSGTGIGTVFVDHQLRILRFTPAVSSIIHLILSDLGRPVGHMASNLVDYNNLLTDIKAVLSSLIPVQREVQTVAGQWYNLRIQPYRTLDNVIEGAVVSFVDITEVVKTRMALHKANDLLHLSRSEVLQPLLTKRLTATGEVLEVSIVSTALVDASGQVYAVATTERARPSGVPAGGTGGKEGRAV